MKPEFKTVYSVYSTTDEYGSRGGCVGVFTSSSVADNESEGRGWYGGKGSVSEETAIIVEGLAYIVKSKIPITLDLTAKQLKEMKAKARESALEKLTKEEIHALGL